MKKQTLLTATICLMATFYLFSQESYTAHTLQLKEGSPSPSATIDTMAWLAGHWQGEAFGGTGEEWWSSPEKGAMMGAYRLHSPNFSMYEFLVIREVEGSLLLQLKHFHTDLKGWEKKEETVDFPLVKLTEKKIFFGGWTFERIDEDNFKVSLALKQKDGKVEEAVFEYKRVE